MEEIGYLEAFQQGHDTVVLDLYDRRPQSSMEVRRLLRRRSDPPDPPAHLLGRITVRFEREEELRALPGGVQEVRVELTGGITPADLRLPWARLLNAAEAQLRAQAINTLDAWRDAHHATEDATGHRTPPRWAALQRRRGRPSRGTAFYADVAKRYLDYCGQGVRDPVARIAEESNYNRNTVAGWIRKARERGFLPPAVRGKAG